MATAPTRQPKSSLRDAFGYLLGDPGSGIRTILDMVTLTRLDCALASAGMMRASLAEAVHYARGRSVFGKMLVTQPIMTRVLADMALDVAARDRAFPSGLRVLSIAARNNRPKPPMPGHDAHRQILVPARLRRRSSMRRWSALAATVTWKSDRLPATIAKRPLMPSGRAPATSWRWMCCGFSTWQGTVRSGLPDAGA